MQSFKKIEDVIRGKKVINPFSMDLYKEIKTNWDHVAKPLDSMGYFEEFLSRIGAIQGQVNPNLSKSRILVMCADNGIVEEGISQSDKSITAICAENIAAGKSSLGAMAAREEVDILAVDVGIDIDKTIPAVRNEKIRKGSRNFHVEPAMTMEETLRAMQVGMDLVAKSKAAGFHLLGMGEMGIGNTTTSSAVAAALLHETAQNVTGRGAGLDDEKLKHKIEIISEALEHYELYKQEPLTILSTVGGFDIAALVGMCIGGAVYQVPIVLDGFISMTAALLAERILPGVKDFFIPSHSSKEPAVMRIREELKLHPVIDAGMALGEGTGAVLMISLLKTANAVYENSLSFGGVGIEEYKRY